MIKELSWTELALALDLVLSFSCSFSKEVERNSGFPKIPFLSFHCLMALLIGEVLSLSCLPWTTALAYVYLFYHFWIGKFSYKWCSKSSLNQRLFWWSLHRLVSRFLLWLYFNSSCGWTFCSFCITDLTPSKRIKRCSTSAGSNHGMSL